MFHRKVCSVNGPPRSARQFVATMLSIRHALLTAIVVFCALSSCPWPSARRGGIVAVKRVEIRSRQTFPFDCERIDGVIDFTVDPEDASNRAIPDLDLVAGRPVRFVADFVLLRPRSTSGRLLVNVVNRGRIFNLPFSIPSRPPSIGITDDIDAGDGFLLQRGWTILQCGWQWDVRRQPGLLGLEAPVADAPPGRLTVRFQPSEVHSEQILSHWPLDPAPERCVISHIPYPALDEGGRLTVRGDPNAA